MSHHPYSWMTIDELRAAADAAHLVANETRNADTSARKADEWSRMMQEIERREKAETLQGTGCTIR